MTTKFKATKKIFCNHKDKSLIECGTPFNSNVCHLWFSFKKFYHLNKNEKWITPHWLIVKYDQTLSQTVSQESRFASVWTVIWVGNTSSRGFRFRRFSVSLTTYQLTTSEQWWICKKLLLPLHSTYAVFQNGWQAKVVSLKYMLKVCQGK